MTLTPTPAYVGVIGADHTIALPPEIPAGSTVAVFVVPPLPSAADETARSARFAATLEAIRAATGMPQVEVADEELSRLIKQARQMPHS